MYICDEYIPKWDFNHNFIVLDPFDLFGTPVNCYYTTSLRCIIFKNSMNITNTRYVQVLMLHLIWSDSYQIRPKLQEFR